MGRADFLRAHQPGLDVFSRAAATSLSGKAAISPVPNAAHLSHFPPQHLHGFVGGSFQYARAPGSRTICAGPFALDGPRIQSSVAAERIAHGVDDSAPVEPTLRDADVSFSAMALFAGPFRAKLSAAGPLGNDSVPGYAYLPTGRAIHRPHRAAAWIPRSVDLCSLLPSWDCCLQADQSTEAGITTGNVAYRPGNTHNNLPFTTIL